MPITIFGEQLTYEVESVIDTTITKKPLEWFVGDWWALEVPIRDVDPSNPITTARFKLASDTGGLSAPVLDVTVTFDLGLYGQIRRVTEPEPGEFEGGGNLLQLGINSANFPAIRPNVIYYIQLRARTKDTHWKVISDADDQLKLPLAW